jgi:hypothetical protein
VHTIGKIVIIIISHTPGVMTFNMVIDRLDRLEEKLDAKLDKAEFYKVLTLLVALGGVVAAIVM